MSDVFISYSRDNVEKVTRIAEAIQNAGYDLWWDADLPPHRSYGDVIQEKIGGAKAVVVVWSEEATKSEWVRAEADMARNQRKLIQTSIDDGMPPLPFNQIQYASLSGWNGETDHPSWQKILVSLSDLTGAKAEHRPQPTPAPQKKPASSPASESSKKHSQLPLILSVVSLTAMAGLLLWLFLDDGKHPAASSEPQPPIAEAVDAKPVVPAIQGDVQSARGPENPNEFNESAVTNDPDGWTNVRASPSRSARILGRVKKGEVFNTHRQSGPWWKIQTAEGLEGYMHHRLISLTADRPDAPHVIFPDSDSRLISPDELTRLSKSELRLARNEIFARHGRIFDSEDLEDHFSRFPWYQPTSADVEVTGIEKTNAETIQAEEQRR